MNGADQRPWICLVEFGSITEPVPIHVGTYAECQAAAGAHWRELRERVGYQRPELSEFHSLDGEHYARPEYKTACYTIRPHERRAKYFGRRRADLLNVEP